MIFDTSMKEGKFAYLPDGTRVAHAALSPILQVMRSITGKWKLEILFAMTQGYNRFGELHRAVPGITRHMLASRLRELEEDGFIIRIEHDETPPRIEYARTEAANELRPVFEELLRWAGKHAPALVSRQSGNIATRR